VLQGQNFRKGHGYFVVKQPSQEELENDISHAEARTLEEKYVGLSSYLSRFGKLSFAFEYAQSV
jgi:hypothetical protein